MGIEMLETALESSLFTFVTVGIISHLVYGVLFLLKPYFIRGVKRITLKYTQDIYFTGYIFLKKLASFLAISAYMVVFLFRLSTSGIFIDGFIWLYLGAVLLIVYTISEIFIDYSSNTVYWYIRIGVNVLSLALVLVTYIGVVAIFNGA
jgi:hypothetical protein